MSIVDNSYPRDMVGYGSRMPHAQWPGGARIAVNFCINYEAGGENNILHGDAASEAIMVDWGAPSLVGQRSLLSESSFEYDSRRGIWRVLRLFHERNIKTSVFAVVMALERNEEVAQAMAEQGHEMVTHGYRWIEHQGMPEDEEREHIRRAVEGLKRLTGQRPVGSFLGRSTLNTRRLLVEEGGFLYDRDSFADELPYWVEEAGRPHLVIPYSLETNDNRWNANSGFSTSSEYFEYMKDSFDMLYAEGESEPKMMSVGLHARLIGRPGRAVGLERFIDYVLKHDKVWICTGEQIARHWQNTHPFKQ